MSVSCTFFWDGKIPCFLISCLQHRPLNRQESKRLFSVLYTLIPLYSKTRIKDRLEIMPNYCNCKASFLLPELYEEPGILFLSWEKHGISSLAAVPLPGVAAVWYVFQLQEFHDCMNSFLCTHATTSCAIKCATKDVCSGKILRQHTIQQVWLHCK